MNVLQNLDFDVSIKVYFHGHQKTQIKSPKKGDSRKAAGGEAKGGLSNGTHLA